VSVTFAGKDGDLLTLVWHFSQESSPPGSPEEVRFGSGHPVQTVVSAADLVHAVDEWTAQLARFPRRDQVVGGAQ
jgi:hypothetical protein